MKILFIVDAQSPIACNWISYFIRCGHEVHIISSRPGSGQPGCAGAVSFHSAPIGTSYSAQVALAAEDGRLRTSLRASVACKLRNSRLSQPAVLVLTGFMALAARRQAPAVGAMVDEIRPDLVHAMRIPCEGMLAAQAIDNLPLIVSTWGNDLTLFARYHPWLGRLTRRTLQRADALLSDCHRDLRLAVHWGLAANKPSAVLPGAGGVQTSLFFPGPPDRVLMESLDIHPDAPVVINPRGFRGYVRNDTFFRTVPLVLRQRPDTVFLCSAMQGNAAAERWTRKLGVSSSVRLLPRVPRNRMPDFFRLAQVMVSPATHDGTPNTLLEAMACGCFPVAGDIESVREWITHGSNGLLFDPSDPSGLSSAILRALDAPELRRSTAEHNLVMIAERAEYERSMAQAEAFYEGVLQSTQKRSS
jgi:glycosyltransferase involved in cell wall biosynthesis